MMDNSQLQKLRDLPIEGVAERLGMQIVRHKALCPFHDDHHASLSFCTRRNTFRCFACGAHGGTIDLVMKRQNMGFKEACQWLKNDQTTTPLQLPRGGEFDGAEQKASPRGGLEGVSRYSRFFEHPGFDIPRFTKAALENVRTRDFSQGGSTITMQLIKNSYFSIDADEESTIAAREGMSGIKRKMQEIVLALQLENFTDTTKQEIISKSRLQAHALPL